MMTLLTLLIIALLGGALFWYWRRQAVYPAAKPLPDSAPASQELPTKYGKDEIVLMVKDPYWLYAYWELSDAKKKELAQRYSPDAWEKSRPLLRVYDLTDRPYDFLQAPFFEIAISDMADNWYIHAGKPRSTFCVDLGRWFPDNGYVTIARSNIVTTPADQPSNIIDPLWPPVEACWQAVEHSGKESSSLSSIALVDNHK